MKTLDCEVHFKQRNKPQKYFLKHQETLQNIINKQNGTATNSHSLQNILVTQTHLYNVMMVFLCCFSHTAHTRHI